MFGCQWTHEMLFDGSGNLAQMPSCLISLMANVSDFPVNQNNILVPKLPSNVCCVDEVNCSYTTRLFEACSAVFEETKGWTV